jgi:hypothetical protein
MIKVNKYSDIQLVKAKYPELVKPLQELIKNIFDSEVEYADYKGTLEEFDAENNGEGPGGAVVLEDSDYAKFDEVMEKCGLNKGEYDLQELTVKLSKGWFSYLYLHNDSHGVMIYLQRKKIPIKYQEQFPIEEAKATNLLEAVNTKVKKLYFS